MMEPRSTLLVLVAVLMTLGPATVLAQPFCTDQLISKAEATLPMALPIGEDEEALAVLERAYGCRLRQTFSASDLVGTTVQLQDASITGTIQQILHIASDSALHPKNLAVVALHESGANDQGFLFPLDSSNWVPTETRPAQFNYDEIEASRIPLSNEFALTGDWPANLGIRYRDAIYTPQGIEDVLWVSHPRLPERIQVYVSSAPDQAQVFLASVPLGSTVTRHHLKAGQETGLHIELDGYEACRYDDMLVRMEDRWDVPFATLHVSCILVPKQ